jgi:integrating conjugative element membrane protein (TIGR03747 family)
MANARRRTGLLWTLKGFGILALLVLVVDIVYVLWPYPNGPQGIGALQSVVNEETALIGELTDDASARVIRNLGAWIYQAAFVWTGLDELMRRAAAPAPMPGANEFMRGFVRANWLFLETAAWGLQLFALRLGVLVLAMPLFLITAIGAAADGVVPWYRRRAGAGRESGFIYHRAKRALTLAVLALWVVYLLPPVPLDPRVVMPPFLLIFRVGARLTMAYFKKYL